ncbi:N-6 DNA methylase [Streptomyces mobaraensis]|uniref:type I restriction-modification system subunit M n=1 Tax=Streptomyces mobaraensis TaxID=35621 RepID=UPI00332E9B10
MRDRQPTTAVDLLWKAADAMRGAMDAANYKSTVLTLLYLRFLSLEFEKSQPQLCTEDMAALDAACAVDAPRWLPRPARWNILTQRIRDHGDDPVTTLGEAFDALTRSDRDLADVLPPATALVGGMERHQVIRLFSLFDELQEGLDDLYEGLLVEFARFEGRKGGEFHTPTSVARLLVEALQPQQGRIYDPCCGTGGLLVQTTRYVAEMGGEPAAHLACYGQEVNMESWQLAWMNLNIHGCDPTGLGRADTLDRDRWPELKADVVLANPPFNMATWAYPKRESRWRYGIPPRTNANFAWLQHVVDKLSDRGSAGVVLANSSMSSKRMGESEIRAAMVEDDLVACVVALPAQLFRSTMMSACVWFLTKDKSPQPGTGLTDRRGQTLFVDARSMGEMAGRAHRVLTNGELARIAGAYQSWRGTHRTGEEYRDVPGFCRSAGIDEVREKRHILTPARYVIATEADRSQLCEHPRDRTDALTRDLLELLDESDRLAEEMRRHLDA